MLKLEISYNIKMPLNWGGFFNSLAKATFKHLKLKNDLEVSLAFISSKKIKDYNRIYRQKDIVTDVLSFSEVNEILICYSEAKKQAKDNKTSIKREAGWLFVHGLLHLLGYTHETQKKYQKIVQLQEEILLKVV